MKKECIKILALLVFVMMCMVGCQNPSGGSEPTYKYDLIGYVISQTDWNNKVQPKMASYGSTVTKVQVDEFEQWLISNVSCQTDTPVRNKTKEELSNFLLEYTTISQSNLNLLFADIDNTGRTAFGITLQYSQVEVIFIEKI